MHVPAIAVRQRYSLFFSSLGVAKETPDVYFTAADDTPSHFRVFYYFQTSVEFVKFSLWEE